MIEFEKYTAKEILEHRNKKFLEIGRKKGFTVFSNVETNFLKKYDLIFQIKEKVIKEKKKLLIIFILLLVSTFLLFNL